MKFFRSISVKNILSYGSEGVELELMPLNVFIGANGSGKSNFLEVFRLLAATPHNLAEPLTKGGGINEWLWKGGTRNAIAEITAELGRLKHNFTFTNKSDRPLVVSEAVHSGSDNLNGNLVEDYLFQDGEAFISTYGEVDSVAQNTSERKRHRRKVNMDTLKVDQSILAQRSDPDTYPRLYFLASVYNRIGHYAEIPFGRDTPARQPQNADLDPTYLFEDASNLSLVLNDLQNQPEVMQKILHNIRRFNPRVQNIITRVSYGTVQIYIQEEGLRHTVPATRLSDGTLRYLCLLVLLCHPTPPAVMCIEEPELGMHPDVVRAIAEMLVDASQRSQILVTTHSDLLVSALSEIPDAVVVCEHDGSSSTLRRLQPDKLNLWLEKYSLGELWLRGEIGGTRW